MAKLFKERKQKVNAIQWTGSNELDVLEFLGEGERSVQKSGRSLIVKTKFTTLLLNHEEHLVKDGNALSGMNDEAFNKKYKADEKE